MVLAIPHVSIEWSAQYIETETVIGSKVDAEIRRYKWESVSNASNNENTYT